MFADLYGKLSDMCAASAGYVLAGLIVYLTIVLREWLKSRHLHMSELRSTIRVSSETRKQLAHLSGLMHADRAILLMFHNGEYFSNGSSILKMSCVTEFHSGSLVPSAGEFRGVLVSTVEDAVQDLLLPVELMKDINVHEMPMAASGYWPALLTSIGARYWCILPLLTERKVTGVVMFTWQNEPKERHLKAGLKDILEVVQSLEYTVNNHAAPRYTSQSGKRSGDWFLKGLGKFLNRER